MCHKVSVTSGYNGRCFSLSACNIILCKFMESLLLLCTTGVKFGKVVLKGALDFEFIIIAH